MIALFILLIISGVSIGTDSGVDYASLEIGTIASDWTATTYMTTMFASDNNSAGNSFDIYMKFGYPQMRIIGWDCNLAAVVPEFTIDIYWREGTADGFETNPGEWTHLGQDVVVPAGTDLPTPVNIPMTDWLIPLQTYGFIITAQEAVSGVGGFCYTNGGPTTFSNPFVDITTYCGLGSGWPPSALFHYRQWNGTVYFFYNPPQLERATWASIKALDF